MRLYPPVPAMTRVNLEPTELGGIAFPKPALIVIPIFAVHRHKAHWENPDAFDPDRFVPEREAAYARTQFMPFGAGPRVCIGASFALVEATAVLATLLQSARFKWDGKHFPEPINRITLQPKGGMPLTVEMI
jgi:cytochrome P450